MVLLFVAIVLLLLVSIAVLLLLIITFIVIVFLLLIITFVVVVFILFLLMVIIVVILNSLPCSSSSSLCSYSKPLCSFSSLSYLPIHQFLPLVTMVVFVFTVVVLLFIVVVLMFAMACSNSLWSSSRSQDKLPFAMAITCSSGHTNNYLLCTNKPLRYETGVHS